MPSPTEESGAGLGDGLDAEVVVSAIDITRCLQIDEAVIRAEGQAGERLLKRIINIKLHHRVAAAIERGARSRSVGNHIGEQVAIGEGDCIANFSFLQHIVWFRFGHLLRKRGKLVSRRVVARQSRYYPRQRTHLQQQ